MHRLAVFILSCCLLLPACSVFHTKVFHPDRWDDSEAYTKVFMGAAIQYRVDPDAMPIMFQLERLQRYVHYHDANIKAETDERLLGLYRDADRRYPDHYITEKEANKFYAEYVRSVENSLPGAIERLYNLGSSPAVPAKESFGATSIAGAQ